MSSHELKSSSQSEGKYPGDIVLFEEDMHYSRKVLPTVADEDINPGDVLEASGGNYRKVTTAADAEAVALTKVEGESAVNKEVVALVRHAIVVKDNLNYNSQTEATVDSSLEDAGIIVRKAPEYTVGPVQT